MMCLCLFIVALRGGQGQLWRLQTSNFDGEVHNGDLYVSERERNLDCS